MYYLITDLYNRTNPLNPRMAFECDPAVLTGIEAMTFAELEEDAPKNPEVQEYLSTFHDSVIEALRDTDTQTGAIPHRGPMTLDNMTNLMNLMPDLYDYLKASFSAIESNGDVFINKILDYTKAGDYDKLNQMGQEQRDNFIDKIIADTYYSNYLPGYAPIAFTIHERYPPQEEYIPFPRKDFWWHDMQIMTWEEYDNLNRQ